MGPFAHRWSAVAGVSLTVLLAACAAAPRQSPRKETQRKHVRRTRTPTSTPTPARPLEETTIEETPAAAATPPANTAPIEERSVPATSSEPESLVTRINSSTAPNVAAALRLIEDGRKHLNHGEADLALERFERAVAIDPTSAYGYYYLARLHFEKKNYDQAIAFANRAVALSSRSDPVWTSRALTLEGETFEQAGRYADARRAYKEAVQADPNNLAARVGLSRLMAPNGAP